MAAWGDGLIAGGKAGDRAPQQHQPERPPGDGENGQQIAQQRPCQAEQHAALAADGVREPRDIDSAQKPGEIEDRDHQPEVEVPRRLGGAGRQEGGSGLHHQAIDDGKDHPLPHHVHKDDEEQGELRPTHERPLREIASSRYIPVPVWHSFRFLNPPLIAPEHDVELGEDTGLEPAVLGGLLDQPA